MSLGYLLASLPMLLPERAPTLTVEAFISACESAVGKADALAARLLVTGSSEASDHPAVKHWRDLEAAIAIAVGHRRLARKGTSASAGEFTAPETALCPVWLTRMVDAAYESAPDPLAREEALMKVSWAAADELGGFDPVAKGQLFAYAVRLRLATRRAARDAKAGAARLEQALTEKA